MDFPRNFVVLDTETTGAPPGARLVEIGALRVRGRHVLARFERLVFPECPIPRDSTECHGISDLDVARAPTAAEVLPEFLEWIGDLPLVAHNARFDAGVLAAECARLGLPAGENPVYCTLTASRRILRGRNRSHTLEDLVRDLGLPQAPHHRAGVDAEHALHLLWRLQDLCGPGFRCRTCGPGRPLSTYLPVPPLLPDSRRVLSQAADLQEAVDLHYAHGGQRVLPLRVSPRFFYRKGNSVVMEALCHHDRHYKSYRMERIVSAHLCLDAPPVQVRRP